MQPLVLNILGTQIELQGILNALAVVLGFFWVYRCWPLSHEGKIRLSLFCLLGCYMGMKILYWVLYPHVFTAFLNHGIFELIVQGGYTWYGAQLGGMLTLVLYAYFQNVPLKGLADATVLPVCLMMAIVRIGCFVGGCCYGNASTLPWAVSYSFSHPMHGMLLHPVQLYEALLWLLMLAVLWFFKKKHSMFDGFLALLYLTLYGAGRFMLEYVRSDSTTFHAYAGLTINQWLSLGFVMFTLVYFRRLHVKAA